MSEFNFEFENENEEAQGDWSGDVECPFCGSTETAFIEMNYEMSVYECQVCNRRFEIEK